MIECYYSINTQSSLFLQHAMTAVYIQRSQGRLSAALLQRRGHALTPASIPCHLLAADFHLTMINHNKLHQIHTSNHHAMAVHQQLVSHSIDPPSSHVLLLRPVSHTGPMHILKRTYSECCMAMAGASIH